MIDRKVIILYLVLATVCNLYSYDRDKKIEDLLEKYYQVYNSTRIVLPGLKEHILRYRIKPLEYKKQKETKRYNLLRHRKDNKASLDTTLFNVKSSSVTLSDTFIKGEMYCFPNPAKRINPRLHIEAGIADRLEIRIYDITGKMVDRMDISGYPQIIGDGQGFKYAYEIEWNVSRHSSGTYIIHTMAYRDNKKIEGRFKCALIK